MQISIKIESPNLGITNVCPLPGGKLYIHKVTNRCHVAVRLLSNGSRMKSTCGKNKKGAHETINECVTDVSERILTSSVICYRTDSRQHGIYLFYIIKKQKKALLFQNRSFRITRKPAFAHFDKHEKSHFPVTV